jgi:hypothetical protein
MSATTSIKIIGKYSCKLRSNEYVFFILILPLTNAINLHALRAAVREVLFYWLTKTYSVPYYPYTSYYIYI